MRMTRVAMALPVTMAVSMPVWMIVLVVVPVSHQRTSAR